MSTHRLGRKFACYSCHTKFYDLGKTTPLCPKCGADQRDAEKSPAPASHRARRVVEPPPPVEADFEVEQEKIGAAPESNPEEELVERPVVEPEPDEEEDEEKEEY